MVVRLEASIEVSPTRASRPEEFAATCILQNGGDEPVSVNVAPLSSPSLALEIEDEQGEPVPLPPPPVPPSSPPIETLAGGDRRVAEYPGFLPAWTPPGVYRARFRFVGSAPDPSVFAGTIVSGWAGFTLAS